VDNEWPHEKPPYRGGFNVSIAKTRWKNERN